MATTTLAQARTRLAADLKSIAGIKRVYDTIANLAPNSPDLPCFILDTRQPFLTVTGGAIGTTDRTLHFDLTFLYRAENQGNAEENIPAIELFVEATITKLYANFTGAGLYLINKDTNTMEFTGYMLSTNNTEAGTRYWGFTMTLDATLTVDTTSSAGT